MSGFSQVERHCQPDAWCDICELALCVTVVVDVSMSQSSPTGRSTNPGRRQWPGSCWKAWDTLNMFFLPRYCSILVGDRTDRITVDHIRLIDSGFWYRNSVAIRICIEQAYKSGERWNLGWPPRPRFVAVAEFFIICANHSSVALRYKTKFQWCSRGPSGESCTSFWRC